MGKDVVKDVAGSLAHKKVELSIVTIVGSACLLMFIPISLSLDFHNGVNIAFWLLAMITLVYLGFLLFSPFYSAWKQQVA